jgi:Ca2+-transporting ATPase
MEPINKSEVVTNFQLTNQDLAVICDFDKRNDSENLDVLKKTYGGLQGVAKLLKTDLKAGINLKNPYHRTQAKGTGKPGKSIKSMQRDTRCEDQEERLEAFGENIIPPTPSETILQIIVGTVMDDPILKVLIVGAVVVMVFGTINCPSEGWSDGLAIIIAVVIVLGVTAGNDWSKERKFKKLLLLQTDKKCRVIRGGEKFEISSWDILVGDVVELVVGDEVAADGIFIRGNGLVIDESPLTGESIPVRKTPTNYCLFSGCQGNLV